MYQNQEEKNKFVLSNHLTKECTPVSIIGVDHTLSAYLTSRLYQLSNESIMVVAATSYDAQKYTEELTFFCNNKGTKVIYFPAYNISPLKKVSFHNEIASRRIECLYGLLKSDSKFIIVTDLFGLRQKLLPKKVLVRYADSVEVGENLELDSLVEKLVCGGYKRAVIVEELGDFSVRGGIVDFFSPMHLKPVRIELFGDFVESIRFFSPSDQRSIKNIDKIVILPACEAVFEKDRLNSIIGRIRTAAVKQKLPQDYIREIVLNIRHENRFTGMEKVTPLIYNQMDSLFDYLPEATTICTLDRSKLIAEAALLDDEQNHNFTEDSKSGQLSIFPNDIFLDHLSIEKKILSENPIDYKSLRIFKSGGVKEEKNFYVDCSFNDDVALAMEQHKNSHEPILLLLDVLSANKKNAYLTVVTCSSETQAKRVNSLLSLNGVKSTICWGFPDISSINSIIYICLGTLRFGFVLPEESIMVMTYGEIFGAEPRHKKKYSEKVKSKDSFNFESLKNGEFVVHAEHGIGLYNGLIKLNVAGVVSDFLLIIYRGDDKLYLPVDRIGLIEKYMGFDEGYTPPVDKMGGKSWERLKNKALLSAEKIAKSLLTTYAKRKVQVGHNFSCNEGALTEFESQFEHEETPDQLRAISAVVNDMEKIAPMDRLVCGDVGYGKTEIALRASFVAVSEAKQVAVLVPTTVLAEQHFTTFTNRFKKYSFKIACLNRFRSKGEQKRLVEKIKNGFIDIVIGTHRLLQKDVSFAALGLVVLDEEQRFGVRHKEKLKQMRTSVDVLALTATPIPRTLHLSLMGIRDISVISTPPEQRRSIITYVCEYDDTIVASAIRNELGRNGQIFFIHNKISTIEMVARRLKAIVPEVRLSIAHGQMSEEKLEHVMLTFIEGKFDMLVCTTIIESGVDVARANTIMVNRAERFGLAQIYQIRGRVGRSDQQAYAYLFIPEERTLGDKASKRLKVLMEHSDLGSGFKIAMNDMRIRGGGTILGASQSGHIADVGCDMFLKLVEDSVAKLKGKANKNFFQTEVNVPMSAFISEDYMPDINQRLSIYRKLAKMKQLGEISVLKEELLDRCGPMPEETKNLLLKIMIKILACRVGVQKIDIFKQRLTLYFNRKYRNKLVGTIKMLGSANGRYRFISDGAFVATLVGDRPMSNLIQARNILIEITRHVSS